MLQLQIIRPNTVGVTFEQEYKSYKEMEEYLESKVEKLADMGWQACELKGSNSLKGSIELTHDDVADAILICWNTIKE